MASSRKRRRRLHYDARIFLFALLGGLPGYALALLLLWTGGFSRQLQLWLTVLLEIGRAHV